MIERHITFNVHPDKSQEFERFMGAEYAPAMRQSAGFIKLDLLREAEQPLRYQMVFRFRDAESAAGWRTSPVHQALQPALAALFSTNEIVGYIVVA
jgi:quinol monooxygenase YgiN